MFIIGGRIGLVISLKKYDREVTSVDVTFSQDLPLPASVSVLDVVTIYLFVDIFVYLFICF